MNNYKLQAPYEPNGDQPEAIKKLVKGVNTGKEFQTLLGATGTGKTFTIANVIQQTEGGTSSSPYSSGIQGFFEKSVPTLAATYAIHQEFKKQSFETPIMSASGLSQVTCPIAISSGASAVGVGSAVNKLDDLISMIAVVRGLKESLKNSIIGEKIS